MRGTIVCALALALPLLLGRTARAGEPAVELTFKAGQTLEEIAEQTFGDPSAAEEIRALNQIPKGAQPRPQARLRLPGQERELSQTALRVASQALVQAKADGADEFAPKDLGEAVARLSSADAARRKASYAESRRLADEAWALARKARQITLERRPRKNRFSVSVDPQGTTRVEVTEGDGVKVIAEKKSATVGRGQAVTVTAGKPPEAPHTLLPPPEGVLPNEGSVLVTASIYFAWKPVADAAGYVLQISQDRAGLKPIRQWTTQNAFLLFQSTLPDGAYFWSLRTVDARGSVGRPSQARAFTLHSSASGGVIVEPIKEQPPKQGP
jgi:hypothetical protein